MAGPNLELFKFGLYLFFPLAVMVHYGDPQWYHDNVLPYRDAFWPKEESLYKPPRNSRDVKAELESYKAERAARRAAAGTSSSVSDSTLSSSSSSSSSAASVSGLTAGVAAGGQPQHLFGFDLNSRIVGSVGEQLAKGREPTIGKWARENRKLWRDAERVREV